MIPSRRIALSALLLASLAGDGPEHELVFAAPEGTVSRKTLETTQDFSLEEFSLVVNGEDLSGMVGTLDVSVRNELEVEVEDTYGEPVDGRPKELRRTYDGIGGLFDLILVGEFGEHSANVSYECDLEGRTVVFTLGEDGEYRVELVDGEGEDRLVDGLCEDMDLRALLPPGPVEVDGSWEVDAATALESLLGPGGTLPILPEDAEFEDVEALEDFFSQDKLADLYDLLGGGWACTLEKLEDGQALVSIEGEVEGSLDLSSMLLEIVDLMRASLDGEELPDFSIDTADVSLEVRSEGQLLWNTEEGRLSSLELVGDVTLSVDFAFSVDIPDQGTSTLELYAELSGVIEQELDAE